VDPSVLVQEWNDLMDRLGFNIDTVVEMASNGPMSLTNLLEITKEDLSRTMDQMLKYPHPTKAAGAIVYISATAHSFCVFGEIYHVETSWQTVVWPW
jgi:hypothetical protein